MLNLLITTANGPGTTGLALLREIAARAHPTARQTILLPKRAQPGASFATRPDLLVAPSEQLEANATALDLTPGDVIRRAFLSREEFSAIPWDGVLIGVQPSLTMGWDVFAQAHTAMGMIAAHAFHTYAVIFNQELEDKADPQDRSSYTPAEKIILHYLRTTPIEPGRAWNVNIPSATTHHRGYKETTTANYSPTNPPPTSLVPRARDENSDVTATEQGFTALTSLDLRVNPPMKY
jgi:broad specificity polyphosphatase/5'/3'-nucleotidase SurE